MSTNMNDYELESKPFYERPPQEHMVGNVKVLRIMRLFYAVCRSRGTKVVVKAHEYDARDESCDRKISKAINAAVAQARVQHEHICDILEMQFVRTSAGTFPRGNGRRCDGGHKRA